MATQAQIEANRQNAQRSTGPRTPDGKAAVRQNAFRHGFTSSIPVLQRESDGDTQQLLAALIEENQPVGVNEEILVYQMAEYFFFQRRASIIMAEEFDSDDCGAREIGLMLRYHTTAVRGFSKALNDLRKLQKERKLQEIGFVSQEPEETPAEPPSEPPAPTAEPPKMKPVAIPQPVQAPIRVEPTDARPADTRKDTEKTIDGQPHTPPKAA
jgi:hypothetical protein